MSNDKIIWDYLVGKIGNKYGVAGLMGNLYAESGLNPQNLQNTSNKKLGMTDEQYTKAVDNGTYTNFVRDSGGYGLAQWTYWTRKQNLLNFAKANKTSIGDITMQLNFLMRELENGYKGVLSVLKSAKSVREASDSVLLNFERPANQGESVRKARASYGQKYYDSFAVKVVESIKTEEPKKVEPVKTDSSTNTVKVDSASSHLSSLKGMYSVTASQLNMRCKAGNSKDAKIVKVLNKGDKVRCYGYYTQISGVKWLLVITNGVTGFCSSKYLSKVE